MTCPGSVALTYNLPRGPSNAYADEGTVGHDVASRVLTEGKPADQYIGAEIELNGVVHTVSADMALHVQTYADEIMARMAEGDTLLVEQRVEFSQAIGVPGQFGTADAIVLSADGRRVLIADLKYGQGIKVFCEENEQLMTYAVGVLETHGFLMEDVEEVTLLVCQPRLDHIDEWTCSVGRLRQHAEKMRLAAKHAIHGIGYVERGEDVPLELFTPTEKACQWCEAKVDCEALRRVISATVYDDFEALDDPEALTVTGHPPPPRIDKLGHTFGLLDLIEGWCRAVRGEVERMIAGGMTVIGPDGQPMKLVEGRKGHRAWADPAAAEGVLTGLLPPEKAYKPRDIISPAAAEKLLGKKANRATWEDVVAPLITQPPGKPKVALGSDPAPPYTGTAGADEFSDMGAE
jgi:hypothetical protein